MCGQVRVGNDGYPIDWPLKSTNPRGIAFYASLATLATGFFMWCSLPVARRDESSACEMRTKVR
jgi:hypothetical protein